MSEKRVKLPPVQYLIIVKTTKYELLPSTVKSSWSPQIFKYEDELLNTTKYQIHDIVIKKTVKLRVSRNQNADYKSLNLSIC